MQRTCFLFGNADAPYSIFPNLEQTIESEAAAGTSVFYVGNHGNFDRFAASALRTVKQRYPEISIQLVLAYHPSDRKVETTAGFDGTYYPPLEGSPRRYALVRANQYMVKVSDSIICYVRHHGNSLKLLVRAARLAKTKKLKILNLASSLP